MLIRDYYSIDSMTETEGGAVFCVSLNPSCAVYKGHFPSHHISPGVCNIRMVTECAEVLLGKTLRITEIHRCRFTSLITPDDTPRLTIRLFVTATDSPAPVGGKSPAPAEDLGAESGNSGTEYKMKAEIAAGDTVCLTLDCTLTNK